MECKDFLATPGIHYTGIHIHNQKSISTPYYWILTVVKLSHKTWHLRYTCQISSIWSYWSSIRFNSDNGFYHIYFEWSLTFQLTIGLSKVQKRRCTFMDSNFQRLVISFKMQHTHCIFLKCVKNVFTTDFFIKNLLQFKLHKA